MPATPRTGTADSSLIATLLARQDVAERERREPHRDRRRDGEDREREGRRRGVVDRAHEQDAGTGRPADRRARGRSRRRPAASGRAPPSAGARGGRRSRARARACAGGRGRLAVAVRVDVEVAVAPADQQPHGEARRSAAPIAISAACWTPSGSESPQSTNGSPSRNSVIAWPSAPREPERSGRAGSPAPLAEHERRDRGEVVGVGRVPEAEQQRDEQRDDEPAVGAQLRDRVVEPEHASSSSRGRGDRRLAVGDAAVVRRQPPRDEHAQAGGVEPLGRALEQHAVLEHAARQHDGVEPARAGDLGARAARSRARARGGSGRRSTPASTPRVEVGHHRARSSPARRARTIVVQSSARERGRDRPAAAGTRRARPGRTRPRARPPPAPRS